MIDDAVVLLKAAGAREVYAFGSAVRGVLTPASDLDLAVSGLPPGEFYRVVGSMATRFQRTVDLVDLDWPTPFTRYLREENELIRVG